MNRIALVVVAVSYLTGCMAEVGEGDEPVEVDGLAEAALGCTQARGPFTTNWADKPTFSAVTNPFGQMSNSAAVSWLQNHAPTLNLSTGFGVRLIAWDDPSLNPAYVAYLMTDTLWAQHALMPYNSSLASAMKSSLIGAGWYGDGLFDTLFRDVGTPAFKPLDSDAAHGTLLGNCPATSNGRTAQIRTFTFGVDQGWTDGQSRQFIDTAVYRALDEYWAGGSTRQTGINRINDLILDLRHGGQDLMFWDTAQRVFVDVSSRGDYDNLGNYVNATYKVGLVLYALKVMGISNSNAAAMKQRLADAQWPLGSGDNSGGLAHTVTYNQSGTKVGASGPTGEATSIGLLSSTVNRVP